LGPFVTVWFIWSTGEPKTQIETPWWILAVGGAGIVVGLATFGKRVMDTIGKDITDVNFTRGFSIEISSTLCVVIASRLGFPISTTHCKVGSLVAVGVMNSYLHRTRWAPSEPPEKLGISWKLFINVGISWLVTVPATGLVAAGLYGILQFTILKESVTFANHTLTY
jgi:sodium-dependent phosphate transporter